MKRIMLSLALLTLASCAPIYYCETEFGQDPPLLNKQGKKYWPSLCYPQDQYNRGGKQ